MNPLAGSLTGGVLRDVHPFRYVFRHMRSTASRRDGARKHIYKRVVRLTEHSNVISGYTSLRRGLRGDALASAASAPGLSEGDACGIVTLPGIFGRRTAPVERAAATVAAADLSSARVMTASGALAATSAGGPCRVGDTLRRAGPPRPRFAASAAADAFGKHYKPPAGYIQLPRESVGLRDVVNKIY